MTVTSNPGKQLQEAVKRLVAMQAAAKEAARIAREKREAETK